ncbi:MAG: hypothetical protein M3O02_01350 [Acidobacteriota bacterium]|nr:hypothetical protein [Acidobacteriota bacterium]
MAGTRLHEMMVGAGAVAASAAFLWVVHRRSALRLRFSLPDVLACWRLPWYILSGCYVITAVLLRDVFTSRRAESLFRVSGFATAQHDARMVSRRVLATAYTTAAPNFIVIGIDVAQSRLLFHQIQRSTVHTMAKQLGATS